MTFSAVGYSATLYSGQNGDGISVTSRVGTLKGFYTFTSLSGDQLVASVAMEKNGEGIGVGTSVLPAAAAFTAFTVNITYFTNDVPDTAVIWFAMAGAPAPHVGSTFSIDDLTWEAATSVSDLGLHVPVEVALSPAYPNPFNPSTTIRYSLPVSGRVALTVFDLLGRQVSSLVDAEQAAGHHQVNWSADGMPSGTYLCRLDVLTADGQLTQRAIRLILAK
ncbi:MAG: T9SS type A sorting domain-containing protein [Bacteroidetes bacterium]|jgi:hypothetical protein|nr:T9SS type A sorting domain-containing protein [Bacteroidota bacterium]